MIEEILFGAKRGSGDSRKSGETGGKNKQDGGCKLRSPYLKIRYKNMLFMHIPKLIYSFSAKI